MRPADVLLLAVTLAGLGALALAAELLEPPLVALGDLRHWDGHAVAVEAFVVRAHLAGAGAQVLSLADGTGRAASFWPSGDPVEGAFVRAQGTVQRDRGAWELMARRVEVLAPPDAPLGVAQAARLAPALQGRTVAVLGQLAWPAEQDPHLLEGPGRLALEGRRGDLAFLVGERVLASGTVEYDRDRARYLLQAGSVRPA